MRLTLKDHRDAMVAMLANGNCPTSAARIAHAMHDVLSYLQNEPEAPVSHSERRAEATSPGLNDKLLALDLEAHRKPQTVNQQVKELQSTIKHRDNTIKQLKENIQLLRDERSELTRQLQESLDREQCLQEALAEPVVRPLDVTPEMLEGIRRGARSGVLMAADLPAQSGVRKEDTELPWIEWAGGPYDEWPTESGETLVDVRYRNGRIFKGICAQVHHWDHLQSGSDIIAYRVVKP